MGTLIPWVLAILVASGLKGSVKIVKEKEEYLIEGLGSYRRKLEPGLNFIIPVYDQVVYKDTIREKVLDVPAQSCITRDNVSITVDAVVYWRIMDMYKAFYKVENLRDAMVNMVLTQIRSEMGKLELDQTFTARTEINEILLRELDIATDPWGVKVTRVELRDIMPSKAVQDSMELQMAAERQKRANILTSEGHRDSAINSAQGDAQAKLLQAEAAKKAAILNAEAEQQAIVLKAQGERQEQILKAEATAEAMKIVMEKLQNDPNAREALQFLLAQEYLEMGKEIGNSGSSKVMFMDPRSMISTIEGVQSVIAQNNNTSNSDRTPYNPMELDLERIKK
ncbi:SPFH/Band 7/PHB domain protein [Waterburya agarophytonicola K14]|uniref:SPFH/Band 7/PHB domain protein n=1 Tax=Waterburya agarophytonicola KI4 TaxID=2874699 RepID=A0A964FFB1_9CYAN|nr:SPFH domain-containing protein [Waterburya agarophytonicola]MCC0176772.1 SPFH/Band 7/PHB domain protein [Waterburya agarophytonicola KI4]